MIFEVIAAVLVRLWMFSLPSLLQWLKDRPEMTTPNNSWNGVKEGLSLPFSHKQKGGFHGSTLLLYTVKQMEEIDPEFHTAFFIACDVLIAFALRKFVKNFLVKEFTSDEFVRGWDERLGRTAKNVDSVAHIVFMLYLFNPMTLFTCVSKTTVVFNNLYLAMFLLTSLTGSLPVMTFFVALASYETLYPVQLLSAACLSCWKFKYNCDMEELKSTICKGVAWFLFWMFLMFFTASNLSNPEESMKHFEYILGIADQTPNVGLFWYFFTEVFEHFEPFFLIIFHFNVLFYSIPLSIKLMSHPVALSFTLLAVISIFKSYPTLGDTTLWLALIPMWSHSFMYLRDSMVTLFSMFTSCLMFPVMWFVWISANAANANFYFASSLAFSICQIYLLCDVLLGYIKWNHLMIRSTSDSALVGPTSGRAILRLVN